MKKLILAALAATIAIGPLAATAAEAAPQRTVTTVRERPNGTVVERTTTTRGPAYRTWHRGERFDRRYAQSYRAIPNWRAYRLSAPPRGHYWYRSGRDAVLVRNGVVVSIRGGIF